ncbi:adenosine 5'-monophosphoramidase HINT3-like [Anopheles bellator]|uniref:adenosine 5'-monophosphoramidase HINT3-like n=1 Tax=Anopheles bellator TaxID=139047 RepID=UPI002649D9A7|nr:adenosine 5'-monophosphoramidase HINT3-like [Anopheles bellator]
MDSAVASDDSAKERIRAGCVFCTIAKDPATEIVFQNERICIFNDIRPSSDFHFLAVPKHHVENVSSLSAADKPLLEELKRELVRVLEEKQIHQREASFGFHIPPFTSIKHLHMHAIAPVAKMGFISRMIFRPNTMWFKTDETVLQSLANN